MEHKIIETGNTEITFYDIYPVYFIAEQNEHSALTSTLPEGMVDITFNQSFEYKRVSMQEWCIFIDIKFIIKDYFSTYIRSSFYLKAEVKKVFITETLEPIMKEALDKTKEIIIEEYTNREITFDSLVIPFSEEIKNNMVKQTIETFNKQRLETELKNTEEDLKAGLTIPSDQASKLVVQASIIIMDKVFFDDEVFDWKYNSKVLEKVMAPTAYVTMRAECFLIKDGPVHLNWASTTYLFISIDCALQLLLGEHAGKLEKAISKYGLTEEARKAFIIHAGRILPAAKQQLKTDGMEISNLDVLYDWNKMIK